VTTQEQVQTLAAWDNIAAGYDEFVTPTHMWVAGEGLRRVGLRPGMRFWTWRSAYLLQLMC
jgi:hypothetical protein